MTLVLIWLLETGKITWHRWLPPTLTGISGFLLHVGAAMLLGLVWGPLWAAGAVLLVVGSLCTINDKRRSGRLGGAFSALSSWPVEIAALWAWKPLTEPLNGLWWLLCAVGGYVIWNTLRPAHWGPSLWRLR